MATFNSASAIIGGSVTRHFLCHVDDYSRTKDLPTGMCKYSPTFTVGDYSWRISYYPNGSHPYCADYISFFLILEHAVDEPVKARHVFSLLDKEGNPVPSASKMSYVTEYVRKGSAYGFRDFMTREFLEASEHLINDHFVINYEVSVFDKLRAEKRPAPLSDLRRHLGDLLVTEEGTDVTVRVAGEAFSAHRCVLAARSPVLKAEIFGATSNTNTGADCCLQLQIDDMPSHVFKTLLHFIYTDSLPEMTGLEESEMVEPLIQAANRYGMQRLKLICEEKLMSRDVNEDTVAKMLRLAVQQHCHMLRKACVDFLQDYPELEAIMLADHGLFEIVAKSCPMLLKELVYDDDL